MPITTKRDHTKKRNIPFDKKEHTSELKGAYVLDKTYTPFLLSLINVSCQV